MMGNTNDMARIERGIEKMSIAVLAAIDAVFSHFGAMAANTIAATSDDVGKGLKATAG